MSAAIEMDGWTPVLNGDVYCSPRCGSKCKKADYDKTMAAAEELARRMGPQWEPRVWENCGWYYTAKCGSVEIYPPVRERDKKYSAWINISNSGCHNGCIQFIESADNPEDALGIVIQKARGCIIQIEQALATVRGDVA